MPLRQTFDYQTPYEIMVGAWSGYSILYSDKGKYLATGPSIVAIYWKKPGQVLRYFQEDLGNLDKVIRKHEEEYDYLQDPIVTRAFDLIIDGKACTSEKSSPIKVEGVESRPGTYLFHLDFPPSKLDLRGGDYYNNQYFMNPNERHIIGPYVRKGMTNIKAVIAQTFTRISYDIPEEFIELDRRHMENLEKNATTS